MYTYKHIYTHIHTFVVFFVVGMCHQELQKLNECPQWSPDTTCSAGMPMVNGPRHSSANTSSNALLQSRYREGLYNPPRWLCLHSNQLAEDLPLPNLGRWLRAGLDLTGSWEREHASSLHLLRCHLCKAVEERRAHFLLELKLSRKCRCDPGLCHALRRLGVHCLHWWQHDRERLCLGLFLDVPPHIREQQRVDIDLGVRPLTSCSIGEMHLSVGYFDVADEVRAVLVSSRTPI